MEGHGKSHGGQSTNHQADQDHFSSVEPVKEMPYEGLGNSVDQKARGRGQRDGGPAPPKILTHGDDEYAEAAPRTGEDETNEHCGGNDVPPVIYLSLPAAIRGAVDKPLDLAIDCGDARDYHEEKPGYQYQQAGGYHAGAAIIDKSARIGHRLTTIRKVSMLIIYWTSSLSGSVQFATAIGLHPHAVQASMAENLIPI